MSDNEPYDPYIPSGNIKPNGNGAAGSSRTAEIQAQIDETVGVMRDNINRVHERGENLDSLHNKTGKAVQNVLSHRRSRCFSTRVPPRREPRAKEHVVERRENAHTYHCRYHYFIVHHHYSRVRGEDER